MITAPKLIEVGKKLFPRSQFSIFEPYWKEAVELAELHTPQRVAAFLAQTGVECQGYTKFIESTYYSEGRLLEVFGRDPTLKFRPVSVNDSDPLVQEFKDGYRNPRYYAYNSRRMANYVYSNKGGNGPEESGDGYLYRGRGPIMCTLKNNYAAFTRDVGVKYKKDFVKHPELLEEPRWGLLFAAWYWKVNKINETADLEHHASTTKKINRAKLHLKERIQLYNKAIKLLS